MINSQTLPTTGGQVNVPGVPNITNNQVYPNGGQVQQPIPQNGGQVQQPIPQNGVTSIDPSRAYVNHILLPCAKAVVKWLPVLLTRGINITEKVVIENMFLPEFQNLAGPIRNLPASGIRAPKTKSRPLAPGVVLDGVPGYTKLYYPGVGKANQCWWRYTRGNNPGIQCVKPVGSRQFYCDPCYNAKKTAQKHYDNAFKMARGGPIRDYLFSLRGNTPPIASNVHQPAGKVVPPQPTNSGNINVVKYPGSTGVLYRSSEGVIYAVPPSGIIAIGIDRENKEGFWIISPVTPQYRGLVNQGVIVNDSLAKQYSVRGGLQATTLNKSGELITSTSTGANTAPIIPPTSTNSAPQGIPGTTNSAPQPTIPQGISGIANSVPQPTIPQGIPGNANSAQPTIPQGIPGNANSVPQPTIPRGIPGNVSVPQPTIPQGIPGITNSAQPTIPQGIQGNVSVPQPTIPQGIPGITNSAQPTIPQGIPGITNSAQPTIPQGIPGNVNVPQPTIPQGIPGITNSAQPTIPQGIPGINIAPITANAAPVPVGSSLPGARATPLAGLVGN